MRLVGEQFPSFPRRFHFRRIAAVFGKLFVEREQHPRGVVAEGRDVGGQIDEIDPPLCPPYGDELVYALFEVRFLAAAFVLTVRAEGAAQGFAHLQGGAVRLLLRFEGGLDFAEEGGHLVELLPYGASVAVHGNARQNPFPIKKKGASDFFAQFFGQDGDEQGGKGAGEQGDCDFRPAPRIQSVEVVHGEKAEDEGEGGGDLSVGDEEERRAGVEGVYGNGKGARLGEREGKGEHDGKGHGGGVFQEHDRKEEQGESKQGKNRFGIPPEGVQDAQPRKYPHQADLRELTRLQAASEGFVQKGVQPAFVEQGEEKEEGGDHRLLQKRGEREQGVALVRKEKDEGELRQKRVRRSLPPRFPRKTAVQNGDQQEKDRLNGGGKGRLPTERTGGREQIFPAADKGIESAEDGGVQKRERDGLPHRKGKVR